MPPKNPKSFAGKQPPLAAGYVYEIAYRHDIIWYGVGVTWVKKLFRAHAEICEAGTQVVERVCPPTTDEDLASERGSAAAIVEASPQRVALQQLLNPAVTTHCHEWRQNPNLAARHPAHERNPGQEMVRERSCCRGD